MAVSLRADLSDAERAQVETAIAEFGRSWHEHALAERVKALPTLLRVRQALLVEMVKRDLKQQWKHGRRPSLENYLFAYPELGSAETVPIELIGVEYQLRRHYTPPADLADFARRFPQQADALRRIVEETEKRKAAAPSTIGSAAQESIHQGSPGGPARPRQGPTLPEQFGRYRILKKLGQGGMGAVFLAYDTQLNRQVALKVPSFETEEGSDALKRFRREATSAATFEHPNICTIYDVGEINGTHYLTMKYVEGKSLADAIERGKPMPEARAAELVRTLALALEAAHQGGIVHRDLKPSNIMLTQLGEPIILDFGLARPFHEKDARLTQTGTALGTPHYMSPEQVLAKPKTVGPRSDVYSLGVVLYELLAGQRPFEDAGVPAIYALVTSVVPPPPRKHRPQLDQRLEAICLKAMAKKANDRYGSMAEFANALDGFLRSGKEPRPVGTARPVPAPVAAQPRGRTAADKQFAAADQFVEIVAQHRSRTAADKQRTRTLVLAVLGVLAVACVTYIIATSKGPDRKKEAVNPIGPTAKGGPFESKGTEGKIGAVNPTGPAPQGGAAEDALVQEMRFVRLPRGTAWLGGGSVEGPPQKQVAIDYDVELAAYCVTQGQWQQLKNDNPSCFARQGKGSKDLDGISDADLKRFPVESVSWNEIQTFLEKLNAREKGMGWHYRLPKEAEWEYGCRAAATKEESAWDFYVGKQGTNDLSSDDANFNGEFPGGNAKKRKCLGRPTMVGQYAANKLGLYDMHGNVWQWCDEVWDGSGSVRVIRGGSWLSGGQNCRAADRGWNAPAFRRYSLGFRLARVPSKQ